MKKNDKKNLEFIKNKFKQTEMDVPDRIKAENVVNLIDNREQKRIKLTSKAGFKRAVSLVACLAIMLTAVTIAKPYYLNDSRVQTPSAEEEAYEFKLHTFASHNEISDTVDKILKEQKKAYNNSCGFSLFKSTDIMKSDEESVSSFAINDALDESSEGYAETYKQVEGVDEGDVIKNNGKNIFWYDSCSDNEIKIYEGTKLISTIDDFKHSENQSDEYVLEMYLDENRLIVITSGETYKKQDDIDTYVIYTKSYIYDISNVKKPKLESKFKQSGDYQSSRMADGILYLISTHYVYDNQIEESVSPSIAYNGEADKAINPDCIYCPESPTDTTFIVISAIDIEKGKQSTESKAFMGFSDNIYCNRDNLYICANRYSYRYMYAMLKNETSKSDDKVEIVRVALNAGNIEFNATGEVKGYINDQFSLDEKDGYLRVATTSMRDNEKKENNLFVLDENLKVKGEVTGFAENESIKSVRFIGDMAYVITYKEIDPLFVIDLSNPEKPEIKGSVKITGFSSLLVPVDESTLLGIGYSTEAGVESEYSNGIKLALFDISKPEEPTVLDSYTLKQAYSEAQYNHRALVVNKDAGYYAIPIEGSDIRLGALVFKIDNNKIKATAYICTDKTGYSPRCTYIDDSLFVFKCASNSVDEYKINPKDIL